MSKCTLANIVSYLHCFFDFLSIEFLLDYLPDARSLNYLADKFDIVDLSRNVRGQGAAQELLQLSDLRSNGLLEIF